MSTSTGRPCAPGARSRGSPQYSKHAPIAVIRIGRDHRTPHDAVNTRSGLPGTASPTMPSPCARCAGSALTPTVSPADELGAALAPAVVDTVPVIVAPALGGGGRRTAAARDRSEHHQTAHRNTDSSHATASGK